MINQTGIHRSFGYIEDAVLPGSCPHVSAIVINIEHVGRHIDSQLPGRPVKCDTCLPGMA